LLCFLEALADGLVHRSGRRARSLSPSENKTDGKFRTQKRVPNNVGFLARLMNHKTVDFSESDKT
jgi:hypothetical protein